MQALGEGVISVAHSPGGHQDLGRGFYLTLDHETAQAYAMVRGGQRGGACSTCSTSRFRSATSERSSTSAQGGAFRAEWERFLDEPPFRGMQHRPGFESNRTFLA